MSNIEEYHSCSFCALLTLDLERTRPPNYEDGQPDPPPREPLIFFDITLQDIQQTSSSCELCSWLLSRWTSRYRVDWAGLSTDSRRAFLCAQTYSSSLVERFPIDEIEFWLWDCNWPYTEKVGRCHICSGSNFDIDVVAFQGSSDASDCPHEAGRDI